MNLKDLAKPFEEHDIEWRAQRVGISNNKPYASVLAYVTNRAIMQRLDDVCGPENWRNEYRPGPVGGVLCGLSIRVNDEWVTKWDGADNTDIEAIKGGLSDSMKRAAVQWGIGRYLYHLEATFAQCSLEKQQGWVRAMTKDKKLIYWQRPALPAWALPDPPVQTITKEQAQHLRELCKTAGDIEGKVIESLQIESLESLPADGYAAVEKRLNVTIRKRNVDAAKAAIESASNPQEVEQIETEARQAGYLEFVAEIARQRKQMLQQGVAA